MVSKKYIDYKTYEIYKNIPDGIEEVDYFSCDTEIAEILSILNKKGYYTDCNSCAGHVPIINNGYINGVQPCNRPFYSV